MEAMKYITPLSRGKQHASTVVQVDYCLFTTEQSDSNDIRIHIELIRNNWKTRMENMLAEWMDTQASSSRVAWLDLTGIEGGGRI